MFMNLHPDEGSALLFLCVEGRLEFIFTSVLEIVQSVFERVHYEVKFVTILELFFVFIFQDAIEDLLQTDFLIKCLERETEPLRYISGHISDDASLVSKEHENILRIQDLLQGVHF